MLAFFQGGNDLLINKEQENDAHGVSGQSPMLVAAAPSGDKLKIPAGFDHWFLVNSMVITKDSPLSASIGGLHHIYVNDVGLARLKKGGATPYPDGTIFVDDVRDFTAVEGSRRVAARRFR